MRKSDRRNCVFHAPPSVIPSPCPSFCPPPPCHSVEPSPLCHSEERQCLDEESIPAPKLLRATRCFLFFLYFLVQESTKEPLHGENGGIRLRSFAERARKTYAVPNTRSGRSLPRRTKPRHFHECGTKPYHHFKHLPVILWSPLPSVILRSRPLCHSEEP